MDKFEAAGGYDADKRIANVLTGLGFKQEEWNKSCSEFSGGWQVTRHQQSSSSMSVQHHEALQIPGILAVHVGGNLHGDLSQAHRHLVVHRLYTFDILHDLPCPPVAMPVIQLKSSQSGSESTVDKSVPQLSSSQLDSVDALCSHR